MFAGFHWLVKTVLGGEAGIWGLKFVLGLGFERGRGGKTTDHRGRMKTMITSGLNQSELARGLELAPSVNISMILQRYEKHSAKNRPERTTAEKAEQMLNAMIRPR
jgi:hypothetical protein